MAGPLVLEIFPGVSLFGRAFEAEGFCVVRGPDLLWGGDIKTFHVPAGLAAGVIGGPPCQRFSRLAHIVKAVHGEDALAPDLIPEFERVVREARPRWFVCENVEAAPLPVVDGYVTTAALLNNRAFGAEQNRRRRFTFGSLGASISPWPHLEFAALEAFRWEPAVCSTSGGRRRTVAIGGNGTPKGNRGWADAARLRKWSVADMAELQGLPRDFLADAPFTVEGKRHVIGNGVPMHMGRAVARAVKAALRD